MEKSPNLLRKHCPHMLLTQLSHVPYRFFTCSLTLFRAGGSENHPPTPLRIFCFFSKKLQGNPAWNFLTFHAGSQDFFNSKIHFGSNPFLTPILKKCQKWGVHHIKKKVFYKSCPKFCILGDNFFLFWQNLKNEDSRAKKRFFGREQKSTR